jgi:hypothetical protein
MELIQILTNEFRAVKREVEESHVEVMNTVELVLAVMNDSHSAGSVV